MIVELPKKQEVRMQKKAFTIYLKEICIIFATSSWPSGVWWDLDIKKKGVYQTLSSTFKLRNFETFKMIRQRGTSTKGVVSKQLLLCAVFCISILAWARLRCLSLKVGNAKA